MIEINLIPDVKQELLRAKRMRTYVISGAIVTGIVAVGVVVLLALYFFTVQGIRGNLTDNSIASKGRELSQVTDLANMLTVQNQLTALDEMHDSKNINSRVFDVLTAINPAQPNQVSMSLVRVDSENKTITIEGQAANGYEAAETLKKTILGTTITYKDDQEDKTVTAKLTDNVSTTDMSYGEDSTGKKVLRFTMNFVYTDAFFARTSSEAIISGPNTKNVTDSYLHIPQSLFSQRAESAQEGN